jgi:hypothetical protein
MKPRKIAIGGSPAQVSDQRPENDNSAEREAA